MTVTEAWGDITGLGLNWLAWVASRALLMRALVLEI